jgi:hypothetical protein
MINKNFQCAGYCDNGEKDYSITVASTGLCISIEGMTKEDLLELKSCIDLMLVDIFAKESSVTKLSSAAQAVLTAAINVAESPDAEAMAAAVLRAVAEHVEWSTLDWPADVQLGIIADELENS